MSPEHPPTGFHTWCGTPPPTPLGTPLEHRGKPGRTRSRAHPVAAENVSFNLYFPLGADFREWGRPEPGFRGFERGTARPSALPAVREPLNKKRSLLVRA